MCVKCSVWDKMPQNDHNPFIGTHFTVYSKLLHTQTHTHTDTHTHHACTHVCKYLCITQSSYTCMHIILCTHLNQHVHVHAVCIHSYKHIGYLCTQQTLDTGTVLRCSEAVKSAISLKWLRLTFVVYVTKLPQYTILIVTNTLVVFLDTL